MTTTQALGWALVHSLWQCALAPAGLASLLSILPSRAARVRYALATATLVLMVAVPLGTALSLVNFGVDEIVNPRLRSSGRAVVKAADGRKVRMQIGFTPVLSQNPNPSEGSGGR